MTVEPIEPYICQALRSGLVVHESADVRVASQLLADGTLEPIGALPTAIQCSTVITHDPETHTLWWVEPGDWQLATSPRLHRLDLTSMTEVWQRELDYPDAASASIQALLQHDGAHLGGRLMYLDPITRAEWWRSLFERIEPDGSSRWTQIGQPGYGFSEAGDGQPLASVPELIGVAGQIAFVGVISGIDSSAFTLATADPETGDLSWSTSVTRDSYDQVVEVDGYADLLVQVVGYPGSPLPPVDDPRGFDPLRTTVTATTPLGEPRWLLDDLTWPEFNQVVFEQVVLADRVVHVVHENGSLIPHHTSVIARDHAGTIVCEQELPELAEIGFSGPRVWPVGDDQVVVSARVMGQDLTLLLSL